MATKEQWDERWNSLSDEGLKAVALLRVVECANGTIQYAFRDKDSRALSVEQTREAMKLSMGIIQSKELPDGTPLPEEIHDVMNDMRRLYIAGFKNRDSRAMEEFMTASIANVQAVGKDRLDGAQEFVTAHFGETLTDEFIAYGRHYLDSLVSS
jgi:hypothetical protein